MKFLLRALHAESLKLRGTLALRMCLVTPAVVALLCVVQVGLAEMKGQQTTPGEAWRFYAGASFALWTFLMVPLLVTLEAALLAGLEHGDRQWKHLLALPIPRHTHYLAKCLALAALLLVSGIAFVALIALGGWLLMLVRPQTGLAGAPPWSFLFGRSLGIVVASLFMAAVQLWVSIRWRSFTVAVATGMSATVVGFLVGQSARFGHWFPWSMPIQIFARGGVHATFVLVASLLGASLVVAASLLDFARREFE